MGSLSFAVGGGLEGLGKGLNEVGTEQVQAQRDATILRLQNQYASERQQAGFTEQEKLQGKTQEFEHGEKEREYQVQATAAAAGRQFVAGQQTEKLRSEEARTRETAMSREDAAAMRAAQSSSGKTGGTKPWQLQKLSNAPTRDNGKGGKEPIPGALPQQKFVTFDPNRGVAYVQRGNRFYRADEDGDPVIDPKSTNNLPATPGELQALQANPYATVPQGYKNGGMTYLDAFEQEHGYVPQQVMGTVQKLSARDAQSQSQGTTIKLPSGRMYTLPPGAGGGSSTGGDADDISADMQAQQDESSSDGSTAND
jgi:hypothetical protein